MKEKQSMLTLNLSASEAETRFSFGLMFVGKVWDCVERLSQIEKQMRCSV